MKILRLSQLQNIKKGHFLSNIINEKYINEGMLRFGKPGFRTHSKENQDDSHTHKTHEVFFILQGKACIELDEKKYNVKTGDIFIVEPGENHHLNVDPKDPAIYIWFRTGSTRNKNQIVEE